MCVCNRGYRTPLCVCVSVGKEHWCVCTRGYMTPLCVFPWVSDTGVGVLPWLHDPGVCVLPYLHETAVCVCYRGYWTHVGFL